jgi:undecaprenyl-diphosphatase
LALVSLSIVDIVIRPERALRIGTTTQELRTVMEFLEALDQGTVPWFENHRIKWLNKLMVSVTHLGDGPVLLGIAFLAFCLLLDLRRYRTAALLAATVVLAYGVNGATKAFIARQRPTVIVPLVATEPESYSFPSGHALNSTAVYMTLALLSTAWTRPPGKSLAVLGAGLLVFLIGVSRLYLGVHFVTDVLAGWAGGLALALTCYWLDEKLEPPGVPTIPKR